MSSMNTFNKLSNNNNNNNNSNESQFRVRLRNDNDLVRNNIKKTNEKKTNENNTVVNRTPSPPKVLMSTHKFYQQLATRPVIASSMTKTSYTWNTSHDKSQRHKTPDCERKLKKLQQTGLLAKFTNFQITNSMPLALEDDDEEEVIIFYILIVTIFLYFCLLYLYSLLSIRFIVKILSFFSYLKLI